MIGHRLLKLASRLLLTISIGYLSTAMANESVMVRMETSLGSIDLELYPDSAPETVKNFLAYADMGRFNGTIFHRVVNGFVIQGGGYDEVLKRRKTMTPIKNEADNGLKNQAGTIAMARSADPHSASDQFFINTVGNSFLNHRSKSLRGWGYAVFGKVVTGLQVVKKIESVPTRSEGAFDNLPVTPVVIKRVIRLKPGA